jgi:hypothetical protein
MPLSRIPGEGPDAFYARIAKAHRALAKVAKSPDKELTRLAGVPLGTATSWIYYARKRGHLSPRPRPSDRRGTDEQAS